VRGGGYSFWAEWQLRRRAHPSIFPEPPQTATNPRSFIADYYIKKISFGFPLDREFDGGTVWYDATLEPFGKQALDRLTAAIGVIQR